MRTPLEFPIGTSLISLVRICFSMDLVPRIAGLGIQELKIVLSS
jgi:hypothetical protein